MSQVPNPTTVSKIKALMRTRLVADPSALGLNPRMDEAPEDIFEIIAYKGLRDNVVHALMDLLIVSYNEATKDNVEETVVFLKRALHLCDALQPSRCKTILKLIVLEDDYDLWQDSLPELQDLAAQALLGLPKQKADFRYWRDIAYKWQGSLPYALHAAIEIDLYKGLDLFWQLYLDRKHNDINKDHPLIDWSTMIKEADENYTDDQISRALEETFYRGIGTKAPLQYEGIIRHLGIKRFSRIRTRSVSENVIDYAIDLTRSAPKDVPSLEYPNAAQLLLEPVNQPVRVKQLDDFYKSAVLIGVNIGLSMGQKYQPSL